MTAVIGFNYVAGDQQTGLHVAAQVYDISSGSPVYIEQVPLFELDPVKSPGSYSGVFDGIIGETYSITSMVYTDPGFTILDPNRAPGCSTIEAIPNGGGGGQAANCEVVGQVLNNNPLIGIVQQGNPVVGYVECQGDKWKVNVGVV